MRVIAFSGIFCWTLILIAFQPISCNGAAKLGLNNINKDCQTLILEQMDFDVLVNTRSTSKYFATMADDVFKRLYSTKIIGITFSPPQENAIVKPSYQFRLDNIRTAEMVLKTFGHMIEQIEVVYDELLLSYSIERYLNTYCLDALINLKLTDFKKNPFSFMSNAFKKIQKLELVGTADRLVGKRVDRLVGGRVELNEIFPTLESLNFNVMGLKDENCLDLEFLDLTSVHVLFAFNRITAFNPRFVEKLLRNNPQISKLSTAFAPLSFLKTAQDLLPKLEKLEVVMAPVENDFEDEIRFRNIKSFTLSAFEPEPLKLYFDHHLEKIKFSNLKPINRNYIDYFGKYKSIKTFEVPLSAKNCTISGYQFSRLNTELPKLEEVTLVLESSVLHSDVMDFVRRCRNLRKLQLAFKNEQFLMNFDKEIDELFDVDIEWDAVKREGIITIEHKYNK